MAIWFGGGDLADQRVDLEIAQLTEATLMAFVIRDLPDEVPGVGFFRGLCRKVLGRFVDVEEVENIRGRVGAVRLVVKELLEGREGDEGVSELLRKMGLHDGHLVDGLKNSDEVLDYKGPVRRVLSRENGVSPLVDPAGYYAEVFKATEFSSEYRFGQLLEQSGIRNFPGMQALENERSDVYKDFVHSLYRIVVLGEVEVNFDVVYSNRSEECFLRKAFVVLNGFSFLRDFGVMIRSGVLSRPVRGEHSMGGDEFTVYLKRDDGTGSPVEVQG